MSKLVLAAVGAGALAGAVYAAAAARKAQNAPVIPVDEELNAKPYKIDASVARSEHLDEDGKLRQRRVEQTRTVTATTVKGGPSVELLDSKSAERFRSTYEYEHQRAVEAQQKAQDVAAQASAAVAAAQLLKEKEAEQRRLSEMEKQQARDLERAMELKLQEAREAAKLAKKEHGYLVDAEREAERKLREQEELMREAARHEETAQGALTAADRERTRILRERAEAARRQREAAELTQQVEGERLRKEEEAAAELRRRAEADRALLAERDRATAQMRREVEEAKRRQEEAALARKQATDLEARAELSRAEKERLLRGVNSQFGDIDAKVREIQAEMERHQREAAKARERLALAEQEALRATQVQEEAQTVGQRFKSWWRGDRDPSITCVADAKGFAKATPVLDTERKGDTTAGIRVDAAGTAKVEMVDTGKPVMGGRMNAAIDTARTNKDSSVSEVMMAESARDIGNVGDVKPRATD